MDKQEENKYISPKEKEILSKGLSLSKSKYNVGSLELYRENIYFIRQYPQVLKISQEIVNKSIGYRDAKKRLDLIERAFRTIPHCYREGVLEHIVYKRSYADPKYDYANIKTWKYWTQKAVYEVAIRRGQKELIEAFKLGSKDAQ